MERKPKGRRNRGSSREIWLDGVDRDLRIKGIGGYGGRTRSIEKPCG